MGASEVGKPLLRVVRTEHNIGALPNSKTRRCQMGCKREVWISQAAIPYEAVMLLACESCAPSRVVSKPKPERP